MLPKKSSWVLSVLTIMIPILVATLNASASDCEEETSCSANCVNGTRSCYTKWYCSERDSGLRWYDESCRSETSSNPGRTDSDTTARGDQWGRNQDGDRDRGRGARSCQPKITCGGCSSVGAWHRQTCRIIDCDGKVTDEYEQTCRK